MNIPVKFIREQFAKLEFLRDDKGTPITLNKFKKDYANVHTYGRGAGKMFIVFFGPKDNQFGVYPRQGFTQKEAIEFAYQCFRQMIDGDFSEFTYGFVQWGDKGIPLSYGKMGRWKTDFSEYVDPTSQYGAYLE